MFASQIDPVSFNFLQNSKQEKKKGCKSLPIKVARFKMSMWIEILKS